ncbi:FadD3 family acyl-CoA ligase [Rhodococcus xishaensis]|uniref:Fatty acid--CoA ligase n=1 Tax=Rhodococcus xishaensis TaxID=2487364 RepID=A0A3S3ABK1_9NOCA|nr:FadD3 family acyl-CoA ligase [Rhodococcus xishaensis]RVW00624.1 fatty acid--CoA ligase [Rhodococcus xishaensis]
MTTEPRTTPAALWRAAEQFGSNEAVADGSDRITYTELLDRVRTAARALMAKDIEAGDCVAVWAPNTHHWVEIFLAAQYVGATLVPISTRYTGHEALELLERTRAKALVVPDRFLGNDRLANLLEAAGPDGLAALKLVVRTPSDDPSSDASTTELPGGEILEWDQLPAAAEAVTVEAADARARAVSPDDVADILFTSGTTGKCKGVVTAHRQTVGIADAWAECAEVEPNDRYLIINPFFHSFGYKAGIMVCILQGATMVPMAVFDMPKVMAMIADEKISVLPGAPTIHQSILDFPNRADFDLSSLRVAVTGAATVPVVLVERLQSEIGYDAVLTAYGQTEAVVVTMCRTDDDPVTVATSSGRAIPGMEVKIGEQGEILVRGENIMLGYLDDPEATKKTIDEDGWLHTGDVGVLDERGYLDITDRLKDMYISGGFNVYPAEVENALARMESVAEAAVIGIPDERMGEVGRAYVVAKPGATVTEGEVIAFCKERLANFKIPREVRIVSSLPRNASGKVLKNDLREGKA